MKPFLLSFFSLISVSLTAVAAASPPWFPTQSNVVYEYESANAAGKVTGYHTVALIESRDGNTIDTTTGYLNKKRQPVGGSAVISKYLVTDDSVLMLKESFLAESARTVKTSDRNNKEIELQYSFNIYGDDIAFPIDPTVGQQLSGYTIIKVTDYSNIEGTWNNEDNSITLKSKRREITGRETLTTRVGDFDCWIVEEEVQTSYSNKREERMTKRTWYSEGVGEVKSEQYNDKGALTASYILVSIIKL